MYALYQECTKHDGATLLLNSGDISLPPEHQSTVSQLHVTNGKQY